MTEQTHVVNPDRCIVSTHKGQRISPELAAALDPVNPATFHQYVLPPTDVALHGHDFDEYWWFTSGTPIVTLWTETTGQREYQLEPGDLVVLVRGCMGHTLRADHTLVYYQFSSIRRPGARGGHLPILAAR